jgi:rhodanese-related sulfurtransferase
MGLLDFLRFGKKRMTKIADFKNRGAIMIDVRSQAEFNSGHAPGTICIPLDRFKNEVKNLQKRKKPVLVCCATGSRSGMASSILNQNGIECYNAGGWRNLN